VAQRVVIHVPESSQVVPDYHQQANSKMTPSSACSPRRHLLIIFIQ
jgi:hypothetical protein